MDKLKPWLERVDALKLNERVLLLAALLLVVVKVWDGLLLAPMTAERVRLQSEVETLGAALRETDQLSQAVLEAARHDPDAEVAATLAARNAELASVEGEIKSKVGRMVPQEQMATVLSAVLKRFDKLEFVALEGLGAEPVLANKAAPVDGAAAPEIEATPQAGAWRHGIRIRFKGSYLDALAYLRALETLPWGFFWDRIELETRDYPATEGSIVVYTVSLDRGWIGV
ncbi:MAG: hypothetical protein AB7I01_20020 [Gammaproteobacteria bacterium]